MDTVKINRISPFKEWLAQQNLNENKTGNVNAMNKYIYEYAEYSTLLNEAYCNLKFDHYNEVFDQCLNDIEKDALDLNIKMSLHWPKIRQASIMNMTVSTSFFMTL